MTLSQPLLTTATLAAIDLPDGAEVPEWVQLLPSAQGEMRTFDGRGPYRVVDPAAIIAASFADPRDARGLIIDENHASEISAPKGGPSPARGRIVEMQSRPDGIWGRVTWTAAGRALLADQSYRGISPVVIHDASGMVRRIKNAALVNYANLRDMVALNQEMSMSFMAELARRRGLKADASEAEILASVPAAGAEAAPLVALQAEMSAIAAALGVAGGDGAAILAAAQAKAAQPPELAAMQADQTAMQAELVATTAALTALQQQSRREKAEAFVDGAIAEARPGVKPRRDYYVSRHMEDPVETEATIKAIPSYGPGRPNLARQPEGSAGPDLTSMNAEQQGRALHDRAVAWQAEQKARGLSVSMFDAVTHIKKDVLL